MRSTTDDVCAPAPSAWDVGRLHSVERRDIDANGDQRGHVTAIRRCGYTRTSNLSGNATNNLTPRIGVTAADYAAGSPLTGTLPDGTAYNIGTFIPNAAAVAGGGNGFLLTNVPAYYTDYQGIDV